MINGQYTIASLGSNCMIEHLFDTKFECKDSLNYKNIISSDFLLLRDTPLNGSTAQIDAMIYSLNHPLDFANSLRISSTNGWLCSDKLSFVIHNGYCRKAFTDKKEMQQYILNRFNYYKDVDVFLLYSNNLSGYDQLENLLLACETFNKDAKILSFSNLDDSYSSRIINIKFKVIRNEKHQLENHAIFENAWNVHYDELAKIKRIKFSISLFEKNEGKQLSTSSQKVDRIIYQFWTGTNNITDNRLKGIQSMKNINVPSVLLYKDDIEKKILPEYPLHPIYQYLSENHKSDYLRCYFMHHFGGGYADIKIYSSDNNWDQCFDLINDHPEYDVIGAPEYAGGTFPQYRNPEILKKLVANGYFIVRPHSRFSTEWWNRVNKKLDERLEDAKRHPAEFPRDGGGLNKSKYPLRWAEVQGEIFHRLCYDVRNTDIVQPRLITGRTLENYI